MVKKYLGPLVLHPISQRYLLELLEPFGDSPDTIYQRFKLLQFDLPKGYFTRNPLLSYLASYYPRSNLTVTKTHLRVSLVQLLLPDCWQQFLTNLENGLYADLFCDWRQESYRQLLELGNLEASAPGFETPRQYGAEHRQGFAQAEPAR